MGSAGTPWTNSVAAPPGPATLSPSRVEVRSQSGRRAARRPGGRWLAGPAVAALLFGFAAFLRWYNVAASYDVFIDEITYRQIAANLAHGSGLTLYGSPFTLHPPSAFLVMAGAVRAFGLDGPAVADISSLRVLSSLVGAALAPGAWLVMRRVGASTLVSLAAGLFIAVDPFQISFDSRVMLEPYAQLWVLGCLLLLIHASRTSARRGARAAVIGAGLCGALTVTTKETFGMVLVATLLVCLLLKALPRRHVVLVLAATAVGYGLNAAYISWTYGFSMWWDYRTDGLRRLLGHTQSTGFNAETTQVSLTSRLGAELDVLAVTYGLLLLGGVASLVLIGRHLRHSRRGGPAQLIVAAWSLCACGYLAYATLFGSIEEQMYYIPLIPCTLSTLLWVSGWLADNPGRSSRLTGLTLVAVPLLFNCYVWQQVHTQDVNSYRSLVAWAPSHVAAGSTVSATDDNTQFLLQGARLGEWTTFAALRGADVDFVVVQTKLVDEGYSTARPHFLERLNKRAEVVFRAPSTDGSELLVFDVRPLTGGSR